MLLAVMKMIYTLKQIQYLLFSLRVEFCASLKLLSFKCNSCCCKVYDDVDVWFNFGLIDSLVFDQVIQDWDATMSTDPKNEKFVAFELGLNARSNSTLALNIYTSLNDRIATKYVQNEDGDDDIIYQLELIKSILVLKQNLVPN